MTSVVEQQELKAAKVVVAAIGVVMVIIAVSLFVGWLVYRPALQGFR